MHGAIGSLGHCHGAIGSLSRVAVHGVIGSLSKGGGAWCNRVIV